MIHYIKEGDIFSIEGVTNYAHGCNCAGSMGRGIVVQFRKRFPRMYENYRQMCLNKTFRPGDVYDYNYGSYLMFRGIPEFIDSRADVYDPQFNGQEDDIFRDYINLSALACDYDKKFEHYGITHVMTYANSKLCLYIHKDPDHYKQIYSDKHFIIFERMK